MTGAAMEYDLVLFSLVAMRMTGCIMFNPVFGRKSIPALYKAGLVLLMSILVYGSVPAQEVEISNAIVYGVILLKEGIMGYIVGYIMQLFLSIITIAGEIMDTQMGLAMSKVYDAGSNINMPVSSSILNAMYLLIFFASNGHLTMMKIFLQMGILVPYGSFTLGQNALQALAGMFTLILIYAVKLALPVLAVEFITEISVGLLMRAVPQINVFVVNLQFKILLGFVSILILVPSFANYFDRLTELMFDQINAFFGF